jgi:hypothetical protein
MDSMAKAITKPQRLSSMNELSDTPVLLIFDIHRINTIFVFDWLIDTSNESFSIFEFLDAIVISCFYNKLAIQPGYFALMFW